MNISEFKKIPISGLESFLSLYPDYGQRKYKYQQEVISKISVDEEHCLFNEKMSSCREYGIECRNYYNNSEFLIKHPEIEGLVTADVLLRKSVLADLQRVDQFLRVFNFGLLILSGYRHPQLQRVILNEARIKIGAVADKLLANPDFYSPHASGAVFDVEVWDFDSQRILPTKTSRGIQRAILESAEIAHWEILIRDNRRFIHHLLTSNAVLAEGHEFIPHPFEYWHYGRNEKLSAFFSCNSNYPVFYGEIN